MEGPDREDWLDAQGLPDLARSNGDAEVGDAPLDDDDVWLMNPAEVQDRINRAREALKNEDPDRAVRELEQANLAVTADDDYPADGRLLALNRELLATIASIEDSNPLGIDDSLSMAEEFLAELSK